jgi:two-component system, cell cycle sensor histidine kinase and response regulator CckA
MKVDTRDLELVFTALVRQADHAMQDGGDIVVSTGIERFDDPYATRFMELPPGLYATVTLTYSGLPLTPEARGQLLSATASPDTLSPLGLAGHIVSRGAGGIDLCSMPDFGESITLYLPITWRPVPLEADSMEEGKVHILLVENHDVVLRGVESALRRRGYRVTAAENGAEALQRFPDGTGFDIVVTDVVMHPVDGVALVEKLREKRPSLLVVFMSGYDKIGVDPHMLPERTRFLAKPFTADALVQQVASLLPDRVL